MNTKALLETSFFVQVIMCVAVLATMIMRRAHRVFPQLSWYLLVQAVSVGASITLMFFRRAIHLAVDQAYTALFISYWISSVAEFVLRVWIIYAVFAEAMRPLSGLHAAGKIVFRWVAVVSGLVAMALLAGPQVLSSNEALVEVLERLQQGLSVLTICLLVFVCFAARPLGLTFRSHLFGVSLGLGVAATIDLVQTAWLVTKGARSVYSPIYLVVSLGFCIALAVWGTYFALPEPERRMILLPTTSPFFFWNRISEILGDAPGHVAVAGFKPDMLAPAEIEMLTAATSRESVDQWGDALSPPSAFPQRALPNRSAIRHPFFAPSR